MRLFLTHDIVALRLGRDSGIRNAQQDSLAQAQVLRNPTDILDAHARLGHRIQPKRIDMRQAHGLHFVLLSLGEQALGSTWLVHGGMRYIDELCWGFPLAPDELWVRDLFVRPSARGQGVFATLLQASGGLLAPDWTSIWSDVDSDNIPSLKAHRSAGFVDMWRARCHELLGHYRFRTPPPAWHLWW